MPLFFQAPVKQPVKQPVKPAEIDIVSSVERYSDVFDTIKEIDDRANEVLMISDNAAVSARPSNKTSS